MIHANYLKDLRIKMCIKRGRMIKKCLLFSRSVMSDSLWPHGLQHERPACPSPSPGACSNSCLLSQWCHPTISSSLIPFSSCLQSFPILGPFLVCQLFASGDQSIRASASVLLIQGWFPIEWIGLISLQASSVKFSCSVVSDSATPWTAAHQASLSITNSRSSLKLTSIESVMPSSHLILCRPLLLLPPIPPSISLFQWVNSSHEVVKVLKFQL